MTEINKKNKKAIKKVIKMDKVNFDVEISNIEPIINTEFSKASVKIMYANGNRNGSYFDKDMIINTMIPTLFNIPVVGNYIEAKDDFGSHDSKVEINSDGGIKYVDLTVPYGVVNESSEISWQLITEEDATIHDYLCCTCILWTGRYPDVQRVIDEGNNQSMEVNVFDGFDDTDDGLFHVTDAEFSSLTILGLDVEPCFESSTIGAYSLDKFKEDFSLMLKEIKEIKPIQEEIKPIEKVPVEVVEKIKEELVLSADKSELETPLLETNAIEQKLNSDTSNFQKEEKKTMKKKEIAAKFALTMEQLEDELRRVLATKTYVCEDWWGDTDECRKYWLNDYDDAFAYAHDCEQSIDVKLAYTKTGDDIIIDFDSASRIKYSPVDWVGVTDADEVDVVTDAIEDMEMSLKEKYTKKFEAKMTVKIEEATKAKDAEFSITLEKAVKEKEVEFSTEKADFDIKLSEKDSKISELELSAKDTDSKFELANKEIESLNEYKLSKENEAKEFKLAEYMDELTEDETAPIRNKINEFSLEEIDNKLAILFAKKNHKVNKEVLPAHNAMDTEKFEVKNNSNEKANSSTSVWDRIQKNI